MEQETAGPEPPVRHADINQVVAWNLAYYRRKAGITQKELGERLGWTNAAVSEAERSWDGRRVREFDAQTLARISIALEVPLIGFYLPPDDEEFTFTGPDITDWGATADYGVRDLLAYVLMPDTDDNSPALEAYRHRFRAASMKYLDDRWAREVARWLEPAGGTEARRDRAEAFRSLQHEAQRQADGWGELAAAIDPDGGQP